MLMLMFTLMLAALNFVAGDAGDACMCAGVVDDAMLMRCYEMQRNVKKDVM